MQTSAYKTEQTSTYATGEPSVAYKPQAQCNGRSVSEVSDINTKILTINFPVVTRNTPHTINKDDIQLQLLTPLDLKLSFTLVTRDEATKQQQINTSINTNPNLQDENNKELVYMAQKRHAKTKDNINNKNVPRLTKTKILIPNNRIFNNALNVKNSPHC